MIFSTPDRAKYVIRWLMKETGRTQKDIATQLGYLNHTSLSQVLNGKKAFPDNLSERIAALDPRINVNFILGTSDDMLIDEAGSPIKAEENNETAKMSNYTTSAGKGPQKAGIYVPPELAQMFNDLTSTVRSQQETIRMIIDGMKADKAGISITNVANNNNK